MNAAPEIVTDPIGIVGSGAAGGALAHALAAIGGRVVAVTSRHRDRAEALAGRIPGCQALATPDAVAAASTLVILAVPDDAITPLASSIRWRQGQRVVHLSGASGASALAAAVERGASVAALHPLMTLTRALAEAPDSEILARFRGCVWALETDDEPLRVDLQMIVAALGGRAVRLAESDRIPYHIAAVLVSNYVVTLMGAATTLWESFGADATLAREALLPLLRAAVDNLAAMEPSAALSGPVARGDLGTLESHISWLAAHAGDHEDFGALREAYVALARLAAPLAEAKGTLPPERAAALRSLLDRAKG